MPTALPKTSRTEQVADWLASVRCDPLAFVRANYPWGEPGELENHDGPRDWQADILQTIGKALQAGLSGADLSRVIRIAVASGHGVGKSALVAWLVDFFMSTQVDCRGVVTANTEAQLRTKTWPELGKWHRLGATRDLFTFTATALYRNDPNHEKTWRIDALPWSETRTEAFAGLHNQGRRLLCIFDEASAIPDVIWETTEGALTDENTDILWAVFGNPTRNRGRFRECFGRLKHRWETRQIDSRKVAGTNKQQIADWVDDYGEDSDFVRVRVRGVFPRASCMQFIATDVAEEAMTREPQPLLTDPLVMGIDVARFGDDQSVIAFRRGRDARTLDWQTFRQISTMDLAGRAAELINRHKPRAVFVDVTGVGGGVVDRLVQLGHGVIAVNFGGRASGPVEGEQCADKRAEMWANMRAWLTGGAIPDDPDLVSDLIGPEFGYDAQNRIRLEKKDDMKKRGLNSPDSADALALTFAHPVAPTDGTVDLESNKVRAKTDYDELST